MVPDCGSVEDAGSARRVIERDWTGFEPFDIALAERLVDRVRDEDLRRYEEIIARHEERGIRVVTVLDQDYPPNLRQVYNRPPFLFVRGGLLERDSRAVAVVGTRQASGAGLDQARRLSGELARNQVTVLSGLARGIDAAAHRAALDAGGRTVAVMGTGIDRIYPRSIRAWPTTSSDRVPWSRSSGPRPLRPGRPFRFEMSS